MIQDIAPYIFKNSYQPYEPAMADTVLHYNGRTFLKKKNDKILMLPSFGELHLSEKEKPVYLFSIDKQRFFLVMNINAVPENCEMCDIGIFRSAVPEYMAFALISGYSLYKWYSGHQYCGACGRLFRHGDKERMLLCPECGYTEYPKISPAVIIGVINEDKILLSQYSNREYKRYALLAGFNEIGESIEETVHREVMEEVGLNIKNIRYYKSQPWSLTDSLLLGFFVELDGDDTITIDEEELAMADWFNRDNIPVSDSQISLTGEMIEYFRNNKLF